MEGMQWTFASMKPSHDAASESIRAVEPRKIGHFLTFAPHKPASLRDRASGSRRKPWFFHNFFHSCGKLRGETLRLSRDGTVPHGPSG
jgi:hypothetical protein